ncbi:hypothetical protein FJ661_12230 [Pseudarthrobacter phenanthrenivorans]|uniref:hypothetical protein n=1 Tax=Pseudarthrobacter phenanthrenivorans TaxID=361575 RepID=UPI001126A440|nr:hypothetical protein [Pseudarthrobacter phenanthrenivorans]TPV50069.1 hypothetical protein FJ661_12230 [Pseudarthrobacter phenanthrenivorans]
MTTDDLNGILPAVKYRVPARLERIHGTQTVFVLPEQFAAYMRQAGITPNSALLDSRQKEIGKVTRLAVIGDVTTIHVQLTPGRPVPSGPLQARFKINRKPGASSYYVLSSIYPEVQQPGS